MSIKYCPRTIAVDFDGVIHKYSKGWFDGTIYDVPVPGVHEAIKILRKSYKVVIFTARRDLSGVLRWCFKNKITVDGATNYKPPAFLYIDDRAVKFTNWDDILKYVDSKSS